MKKGLIFAGIFIIILVFVGLAGLVIIRRGSIKREINNTVKDLDNNTQEVSEDDFKDFDTSDLNYSNTTNTATTISSTSSGDVDPTDSDIDKMLNEIDADKDFVDFTDLTYK